MGHAQDLLAVARGGGDCRDRGAMAFLVDDAAVGGDVLARGVDPARELGQVRIDAGIEEGDLDAIAGGAGIVGRQRIMLRRPVRPPIFRIIERR